MAGPQKFGVRRAWQTACVVMALLGVLTLVESCSARHYPQPTSVEQPDDEMTASPLDEDESWADQAGEIGVVGVAVAVVVGGILLPLLLL